MKLDFGGYGCLKTSISLFLFIILIAGTAWSAERSYLDTLLDASQEKELDGARYWEVLLHYKKTLSGHASQIDDPKFFLSAEGKNDPRKELEATIEGFFLEGKNDDSHPRCRFPARYEWLKKELDIDESILPAVSCNEFHEAYDKIRPKSAVLVFPSAYINGPASTFGHTLIRIDSDYQSKLLSYAATYGADATDTNGMLYAFKGIFGFYKGFFTILPYYEKIKEYNDLEQRDIWEYRLDLTEEEVSSMLLHLWELKDIYSYYYFFDENCSYTLLFLLEAARPALHLTDEFSLWVVPIDTLRAVKNEGLIDRVEYRPSKGTKIRHIVSQLDEEGKEEALGIVGKKILPEDISGEKTEKARILDLVAELIQYRYNKKLLDKEEYQKEFLGVLKARSQLGSPEEDYEITAPLQPEMGHGSSRFSIGLGFDDNDFFQEIRYRAAQHELTDPDKGYIEGSEIVFFGATARNTPGKEGLRLENLDVISIVSLSPRDRFFKPTSWKVKTGLLQKTMSDGDDELVYHLNPGGGFAFKSDLVGLYYFMVETDLNVSGAYDDDYSFGVGPSAGVIKEIADFWKMNLFANAFFYELGDQYEEYRVSLAQIFRLNRNNSLNLDISWEKEFKNEDREVKLNWNLYF